MAGNIPGYLRGFGIGAPHFRSLCAIKSEFGLGSNGMIRRRHGTGFFFHTKDNHSYVLTAAHNLYRHELTLFATGAELWFGRAGGGWAVHRVMQSRRLPQSFSSAPAATAEDDYCVIQIARLEPEHFSPIGLRSDAPDALRVRLSAYPNEGPAHGTFQPYYGEIDLVPAGPGNFGYVAKPTYEGQSGGPLLLAPDDDGAWEACGLHIRGAVMPEPPTEARAIRFSEQIFDQLREWLP